MRRPLTELGSRANRFLEEHPKLVKYTAVAGTLTVAVISAACGASPDVRPAAVHPAAPIPTVPAPGRPSSSNETVNNPEPKQEGIAIGERGIAEEYHKSGVDRVTAVKGTSPTEGAPAIPLLSGETSDITLSEMANSNVTGIQKVSYRAEYFRNLGTVPGQSTITIEYAQISVPGKGTFFVLKETLSPSLQESIKQSNLIPTQSVVMSQFPKENVSVVAKVKVMQDVEGVPYDGIGQRPKFSRGQQVEAVALTNRSELVIRHDGKYYKLRTNTYDRNINSGRNHTVLRANLDRLNHIEIASYDEAFKSFTKLVDGKTGSGISVVAKDKSQAAIFQVGEKLYYGFKKPPVAGKGGFFDYTPILPQVEGSRNFSVSQESSSEAYALLIRALSKGKYASEFISAKIEFIREGRILNSMMTEDLTNLNVKGFGGLLSRTLGKTFLEKYFSRSVTVNATNAFFFFLQLREGFSFWNNCGNCTIDQVIEHTLLPTLATGSLDFGVELKFDPRGSHETMRLYAPGLAEMEYPPFLVTQYEDDPNSYYINPLLPNSLAFTSVNPNEVESVDDLIVVTRGGAQEIVWVNLGKGQGTLEARFSVDQDGQLRVSLKRVTIAGITDPDEALNQDKQQAPQKDSGLTFHLVQYPQSASKGQNA